MSGNSGFCFSPAACVKSLMSLVRFIVAALALILPSVPAALPIADLNGAGYITAVLRSECTSAPSPPPSVGQIAVGPDYVIMTVAVGDPLDYLAAQQVVTDAVFESLMPLYCALPRGTGIGCVANRVQMIVIAPSGVRAMPRMVRVEGAWSVVTKIPWLGLKYVPLADPSNFTARTM